MNQDSRNNQISQSNGMATAGLIVSMVSIFIPFAGMTGLIGLIFSIISLTQNKGKNVRAKIYGILGIIIGIVGIVYGIYYFITTISELKGSLNDVSFFLK